MRGYANSPFRIAKVEYSVDGGSTWEEAALVEPRVCPTAASVPVSLERDARTYVLASGGRQQRRLPARAAPSTNSGSSPRRIAEFRVEVT